MKYAMYLGDGVYATFDREAFHPLILTTGNHDPYLADQKIFFESEVTKNLVTFLKNPEEVGGVLDDT